MTVAPVRMGVLSCADIAWRRMLPAMTASPAVLPVAVASRETAKAETFAGRFGCDAVTGYAALLERPDVEAVYIPLPTGLRAEWVGRALRAGKHVLAEKPLATSREEAEGLLSLAERSGLLLVENLVFPHHSQHEEVRRLLGEGAIGELRSFAGDFGIPPRDPGDFRYRPQLGGGALFEVGVYPIRAAQLFLGGDLEVCGAFLRYDAATGVDVDGGALLCSPRGVSAQIRFGFEHSYRSSYSLWGSLGSIFLDRAYTSPDSMRPVVRLERQDHVEERTLPADRQFVNILESFARSVRQGESQAVHTVQALAQAGLVDEIRRTARRITI
ncbi:Gfo/Idh/MocA family oxidoreductase [Streptosporangium longisporum]|uniref:Gfo/Idh/MocA family oxidoreductase n=1 Tax=Streptosporangium longisporum TaxID=46187 RepID=A0ABN3Y1N9_9ACTN